MSNLLDAVRKERRWLFWYKRSTFLTSVAVIAETDPFLRSLTVPWSLNLFTTLWRVLIAGKFLAWYPGLFLNERRTLTQDLVESHISRACFFSSKLNITTENQNYTKCLSGCKVLKCSSSSTISYLTQNLSLNLDQKWFYSHLDFKHLTGTPYNVLSPS